MNINATYFQPPDVTYWPWGVLLGWPLALVFWFLGRKAADAVIPRAALSLAIAFAVAPTIVSYGDRPFLIHAFTMLRHVFGDDPAKRWTGIISATPPILACSFLVFVAWSILKRSRLQTA